MPLYTGLPPSSFTWLFATCHVPRATASKGSLSRQRNPMQANAQRLLKQPSLIVSNRNICYILRNYQHNNACFQNRAFSRQRLPHQGPSNALTDLPHRPLQKATQAQRAEQAADRSRQAL